MAHSEDVLACRPPHPAVAHRLRLLEMLALLAQDRTSAFGATNEVDCWEDVGALDKDAGVTAGELDRRLTTRGQLRLSAKPGYRFKDGAALLRERIGQLRERAAAERTPMPTRQFFRSWL
jgi:hypothetical protein